VRDSVEERVGSGELRLIVADVERMRSRRGRGEERMRSRRGEDEVAEAEDAAAAKDLS
jgi:adenylate kinase